MKTIDKLKTEYPKERKLLISNQWLQKSFLAFIAGGFISMFGQWIWNVYITSFSLTEKEAIAPMLATLIVISGLLTGLGWYKKLSRIFGAGVIVPITGFTNSLASAAMEYRHEGLVSGIGANMFRIGGAVLIYGVVSAYVVSMVRLLVETIIQ
ncbi:stage V sporulation protein AC [Texcoconibacillus texcoconensis]|uniref:Stage V sporulation protein AC n=1 Tax=Texcoconibacillus texcoconensis TaxID=1095777 RepID=A0A840QNR6_9BACI|nr:stage V sporulation protein AC [Texcoconibacillus texcoconensis]MBB5172981.1 stage V sporulation protein AC [Texcoconibacillus texcoconensis]